MVTEHTLSFVRPLLKPASSVLDVGCGSGYVLAELASEREVVGIDIVDTRNPDLPPFRFEQYDGVRLPFPSRSFDVVLLIFVLHHVPNSLKPQLLDEARRVARHHIVVLEDTPRTPLDWLAAWLHGRKHRREIGSTADFGFYTQRRWESFFAERGLKVTRSSRVPRLGRIWWRPWARCAFWLEKTA
jgi:SAM-dependent methyltransferase